MLTKRGSIWWTGFYIGSGKNRQRIRRSLRTEDKLVALDRLRKLQKELEAEGEGRTVRFDAFCEQYIDYAWSEKPASAKREKQRLEKIKAFFKEQGVEYLEDVTSYHIQQLKAELRKTGWRKKGKEKPASKATTNRYRQILRGMFYRAQDWRVYSGPNPVKKVRFYKEESPVRFLRPGETKRILDAAKEISEKPKSPLQRVFYDIVVFALNTDMRKSEILQLKWNDIDNGEAKVRGKGDKVRMVPLNKTAQEVINRQQKRDAYVFDVPNQTQHDLMRRTVATIRKKTGIDWHFHMLRHTFATRLIEKGVDFVTLAEILGHSKYTISLIYGHTTTERMRSAVECLE